MMVIVAPPRRRNRPDNFLLLLRVIKIINSYSRHIFYVRENVRLYNYCGLVTTVYFVLNLLDETT